MKCIILLSIFITCFYARSNAQQKIDINEFGKNIGKTKTLCDTIYSFRIVSDTLTLVNMGGAYPHQKYTLVIKGNKIQLDWEHLKGKHVCVKGVLELYKGQPEIIALEPDQIIFEKK